MTVAEPNLTRLELAARLKKLMLLRLVLITLLFGSALFLQIRELHPPFGNIQGSHYLFLAGVYLLTLIYALALKYAGELYWVAYSQILLDTFIVTALIYLTGGIESLFSFFYILTIITGSMLLYHKGAVITASSSSILYGLLLDLHYYNLIEPVGTGGLHGIEYQGFKVVYLISVNIAAFYLVASLSSYLAEQVRKGRVELTAKQEDIDKLEVLNQSIINSIASGLIALDNRHRIILFNPAAEEIFDLRTQNALGQKIARALPDLQNYVRDLISSPAVAVNRPAPIRDLTYNRPNGENFPLRLSVSPLNLPSGEEQGHILIFQNMSEIERIEEEMKRMEGLALIGELSAGIAHEIRNPMASISGSIQMLKEGLETSDVNSRLIRIISREVDRLNNLVKDFQVFARPKKAVTDVFELNQLILDSLELIKKNQLWHEKIEIRSDFRQKITLDSDSQQIKQILWNLFLNACQAMAGGGILYVKTCLLREAPAPQAEIVIRDTGPGFEGTSLKKAFEPFFTTKEEGSGLGLAIVKSIVESLHGKIDAGNDPERGGARILLRLPLTQPSRNSAPPTSATRNT